MSEKIDLKLYDSGHVLEHTSNKKMDSFVLKASCVNLLPYELWNDNYRIYNIESTCYKKYNGYVHYDFSKISEVSSNKELFTIYNLQNICDLKSGDYTVSFEVSNVNGDDLLTNVSCYLYYKQYGTNVLSHKYIGSFKTINKVQSLTFTISEDMFPLQINICRGFWGNYTGSKNLSFDFTFLGLTNGTEPLSHQSNSFSESPQIFTENTNNKIGEYEISNNIRRHLSQIERHISNCEEKFK